MPLNKEKLVDLIGYATAAAEKAAALATENEQLKKAAAEKSAAATPSASVSAELIDAVTDALVVNGRISASQREKAAELLVNHESTLDLLVKVARHRVLDEQSPAPIGKLVPNETEKSASAGGNQQPLSPFVGERSTRLSPADQGLFRHFGVKVG